MRAAEDEEDVGAEVGKEDEEDEDEEKCAAGCTANCAAAPCLPAVLTVDVIVVMKGRERRGDSSLASYE